MENVESPASPVEAAASPAIRRPRRPFRVPRSILLAWILGMIALVAFQGPRLLREYADLKRAWSAEVSSRVVHYKDVLARPSYAAAPSNWYHDAEDGARLWAAWDGKAQTHRWYHLGYADINPKTLSASVGRDASQAIDCPILQGKDGDFWGRIPPDHRMFVAEVDHATIVYPKAVLGKVIVVNDATGTRPVLAVWNPLDPDERAVDLYDPVVNGKRFLLRPSGYLIARKPLLYDRDEEGLWAIGPDGVKALSGTSKGVLLKRIARMKPADWGDVRKANPGARLLVGADRKQEAENR